MTVPIQSIIDTVSRWEGVTAAPHRFGGTEFNLGKVEIGHVHNFGLVDVPFTRRLRSALVESGDAQPHHILPESGWISFYVRGERDAEQAVRLLRLSYLHKRGRRAGASTADEAAALAFPPVVMTAFSTRSAEPSEAEGS